MVSLLGGMIDFELGGAEVQVWVDHQRQGSAQTLTNFNHWTHLAVVYSKKKSLKVYINAEPVFKLNTKLPAI